MEANSEYLSKQITNILRKFEKHPQQVECFVHITIKYKNEVRTGPLKESILGENQN